MRKTRSSMFSSCSPAFTLSGGEPLQQRSGLVALLETLADFDIVLYTGFELEDVPDEVLRHLSAVKVGAYHHEERTTTEPYRGSRNQRMIILREAT